MTIHYIHRGLAKKDLKENTLPAFRYSFKKKYGIETDLHITKDNKFICFHYYNLKSTFNVNKKIKDIKYAYIKKITNKNKMQVPLLEDLLKLSRNKYPLLLEIKPVLSVVKLKILLKLLKKIKYYKIISFKEKNLVNLYYLNNKLPLGLLFYSKSSLKKIKEKAKKKYVKFLVLEQKFLSNKNFKSIKKNIFYYTIKKKSIFNKYSNNKNLIFENL